MKLFVYHSADYKPQDIHAVIYLKSFDQSLCSKEGTKKFTYQDSYDKKDYLDTAKPFCIRCKQILKDDYNINMKQLAINQKLGVK